jgi:hypothetical protein
MNGSTIPGQIWETACARTTHWVLIARFGDWAHSFPCHYRDGKVILVQTPDRSLSLRLRSSCTAGKTFSPIWRSGSGSFSGQPGWASGRGLGAAPGKNGRWAGRPPTGPLGARFRPRQVASCWPAAALSRSATALALGGHHIQELITIQHLKCKTSKPRLTVSP